MTIMMCTLRCVLSVYTILTIYTPCTPCIYTLQVERLVMANLFWSHDPVMASVHQSEDWVLQLREKVRGQYDAL
jgi:hypothetical protein